ncbi:short chain dehydrogenase [Fusarium austroafricanum]|uniref:Short chain dehydrogenase n=1 Tax=Fusarium austroafricanum TaxID=2364996 RepID=A0A8H4KI17_9HYPO|nr:short chain dehydrogenase [Fusarium austroafricanum]
MAETPFAITRWTATTATAPVLYSPISGRPLTSPHLSKWFTSIRAAFASARHMRLGDNKLVKCVAYSCTAFLAFRVSYRALSFINVYFLHRGNINRYKHHSESPGGVWAVVTNATNVIGLTMSLRLAEEGFNVLLQGDDLAGLRNGLNSLHARCPSQSFKLITTDPSGVTVVERLDFEHPPINGAWQTKQESNTKTIDEELLKMKITVLVNSVDIHLSGPCLDPQLLLEKSEPTLLEETGQYTLLPIQMTRRFLPYLMNNRPALIMTLGLQMGEDLPLLVSHSAGRSFQDSMTKSLSLEMKLGGLDIEVLCVKLSATYNDDGTVNISSLGPLPAAAIARVGCGECVTFGNWLDDLKKKVWGIMPRRLKEMHIIDEMRQKKDKVGKTRMRNHQQRAMMFEGAADYR